MYYVSVSVTSYDVVVYSITSMRHVAVYSITTAVGITSQGVGIRPWRDCHSDGTTMATQHAMT